MTKNDLLAEIVKTYSEIESQLMVIGKTMENVLNKTNNKDNFTAQRFCADFDIILQHTLIEIAVADNNLAPEELATAEGVTTYGDIMLLSKSAGMDITWKDFYKSAEKYFLPGYSKKYYVFTDNEKLAFEENLNVKKINVSKKGWPWDSMLRFDMFLSQKKDLKNFNYLFFFNADIIFKNYVKNEILPTEINDGLMTGSHPAFYNKQPDEFSYDRNPKSTAYIPYGEGKHYATGAINGGTSKAYLAMCEECSQNVHIDMNHNIIALWHDESHLNKYLINKNPLIMPVNYLYPLQKWMPPNWYKTNPYKGDIKIAIRDKTSYKYGGHAYLRGEINVKYSILNKLKYKFLSRIVIDKDKKLFYESIEKKLKKY